MATNTFPDTGKVGIGTTEPDEQLHVAGDFLLEGSFGAIMRSGRFGSLNHSNGDTDDKWIKLGEFVLEGNWNSAGADWEIYPGNRNHGNRRQRIAIHARNSTTDIEGVNIQLLNLDNGFAPAIKDVKVVRRNGTGTGPNTMAVWVQMGSTWLNGHTLFTVHYYGTWNGLALERRNQHSSIRDSGKRYPVNTYFGPNRSDGGWYFMTGKVGIGTTSPAATLEVAGDIKASFFKAGQGHSGTVRAGQWYRIAENTGEGKRANAEFSLRDIISSGGHSSLTFRVGSSYNDASGMSFILLSHSRYKLTTFTRVRVLEKGTYHPQYVEVYLARAGDVEYSIYDNLQADGWEPVDWAAGSIPDGYSAREFDVDNLFSVGDSGDRLTVTRGGNVGIGTTIPQETFTVAGGMVGSGLAGVKIKAVSTGAWKSSYGVIQGGNAKGSTKHNLVLNPAGGKVGIGTTNPSETLHVEGSVRANKIYGSGGNDFAEWLPHLREDEHITAGDIIGVFGGKISKATAGAHNVFAVSGSPLVVGNAPQKGKEHSGSPVAFVGQVRAKIRGPINEGDYVVPSGLHDGTGVAVSLQEISSSAHSQIVGMAWEESDEEKVKLINVVVGIDFSHAFNAHLIEAVKELKDQIAQLKTMVGRNHPDAVTSGRRITVKGSR